MRQKNSIRANRLLGAPDCFQPNNHIYSFKKTRKFACENMENDKHRCRKCRKIERKYEKLAEKYD